MPPKQLTPEQRCEIAKYAACHGIYATVRHFGVGRGTVRTWFRRATCNTGFEDKPRVVSYTRKPRKKLTSEERHQRWTARFWSRIRRNKTGCWIWIGPITGNGNYPSLGGNPTTYAHRWAWEQKHGVIPHGQDLHHACKNTLCVNPDHLKSLTRSEHIHLEHSLLERCDKNHLMRLGRCSSCERAVRVAKRNQRRREKRQQRREAEIAKFLASLPPAQRYPGVQRRVEGTSVYYVAYGHAGNRQNAYLGTFRKFEDACAAADRFREGTRKVRLVLERRRDEARRKWLRNVGPPPKYIGVKRVIAKVEHRVSYAAELTWSDCISQHKRFLGSFKTAEEAARVRDEATRKLPPTVKKGPGGASRRYNFPPPSPYVGNQSSVRKGVA